MLCFVTIVRLMLHCLPQGPRTCWKAHADFDNVYQGMYEFTKAMDWYISAFFDATLEYTEVVFRLCYVLFFLRYWNEHIRIVPNDESMRFSHQTTCDFEISIGCAVSMLAAWEDFKLCSLKPDMSRLVRCCIVLFLSCLIDCVLHAL